MGVEIEAKMKVASLAETRQALERLGAKKIGNEFETNIFFDANDAALKKSDRGLRLRIAKDQETGKERYIVTMKGPAQPGELKQREETQFTVDDSKAFTEMLAKLGFNRQLSFEKRRETWEFQECEIALDEVAILGTFVEIEGPTGEQVMAARKTLGLEKQPMINTGYIAMIAKHVEEHKIAGREIRL